MTNHRTIQPDARKVIVGVDTHTHVHVAVAIDTRGVRLDDRSCAADADGYQQLITWAERHGRLAAFGIEGTGSDGAGLARAVRRAGHQVLEVNRGDRRTRRIAGKADPVDAETAARAVLAGQSTAIPKTADGAVEMMRHLNVAPPDGGPRPHLGDDHAEADRRHRAARAARGPSTRSPTRRSSHAAADGAAARSIRRPPRRNRPSGRSPVAGSLSPSKSWTTTGT